jgi:hypothetical protein
MELRNVKTAGLAFACVCVFLAAGCANQASLSIYSTPEGAYITETGSGKAAGIAPVTVHYDRAALKARTGPDGCRYVHGFVAHWVSGVTATLPRVHLCGSDTGDYRITFTRDPSALGLDKDMQFALQRQQLRAQQQQAQATEDAAAAARLQAFIQAQQAQQNRIICNSVTYGDFVQTYCN